MAKGESGVETALRYKKILSEYINTTPVNEIPVYRGSISKSGIAEALQIDRKRLDSPHCAPLIRELNKRLQNHFEAHMPENSSEAHESDSSMNTDKRFLSRIQELERQNDRLEKKVKSSEKKIDTLQQRLFVLQRQIDEERKSSSSIVKHFQNSVRNLNAT